MRLCVRFVAKHSLSQLSYEHTGSLTADHSSVICVGEALVDPII